MKKILTIFAFIALLSANTFVAEASVIQTDQPTLEINILSSKTLSGIAGDYVTVLGEIKNTGTTTISHITTYLSLVDTANRLPVDLEDWSAEKGQYVGSIDASSTLPLQWKIHFVKQGTYTLSIIANIEGQDKPITSAITYFNVAQKKNLDPGHVLPVALGEPIVILLIFGILHYRRERKIKRM
jgi:cyclic lactone autoinducer peptide